MDNGQEIVVWRIQANTVPEKELETGKQSEYFIKTGILGIGWSLNDRHIKEFLKVDNIPVDILRDRDAIRDIDDYEALRRQIRQSGKGVPIYGKNLPANLLRLREHVKPNHLVWIRSKGLYYIARIPEGKEAVFNHKDVANDTAWQIQGLEWLCAGDESEVHGAITTAFIAGHTLQRIKAEGVLEFSKLTYNSLVGKNVYATENITSDGGSKKKLFSYLSPSDCEDLLCMYLFRKYGYIVIPSTNKKGTELYECVMLDPDCKKRIRIYPQAKKGNEIINVRDYTGLTEGNDNKVFLFQTWDNIDDREALNDRICVVSSDEMFSFACDNQNRWLLPDSIRNWLEWLHL